MRNYQRTAAGRNNPLRTGKLSVLVILLFLMAICIVITNAITGQARGIAYSRSADPSQANCISPPLQESQGENWMLTLVNAENPLPDNHAPKLKSLDNGLQFDERAINQLNAMLSAAKAEGLSPLVCSAYRTIEKQRTLFNNQVKGRISKGMTQGQAEIAARKVVAYPGTSEHNLGLAADIVSRDYQLLDEAQADTPEVKWLMEHCGEYGFILRYPKDKMDITGIIYEPWHFRYVGIKAAKEIMTDGLCLEEYLAGQGKSVK